MWNDLPADVDTDDKQNHDMLVSVICSMNVRLCAIASTADAIPVD